MSVAKDMAALRDRDPGFLCAYCAAPLALPIQQAGRNEAQWERDGWELYLLPDGEPIWEHAALAHRDHVEPTSKGGPDRLDNMVLACDACNVEKGARPLILFLATRAGVPRVRTVGDTDPAVVARAWSAA